MIEQGHSKASNERVQDTEEEPITLDAIGINGVPTADPMVRIFHLLVRTRGTERGTEEPVWRLSHTPPTRPGYTGSEIEAYRQNKRLALLEQPIPVRPGEMALCVHPDFLTFFQETCGTSFQRKDDLRWSALEGFEGVRVAVAPLDALLRLRKWAANRLLPKVGERLRDVYGTLIHKRVVLGVPSANERAQFETFHDFLEKALFSVDSVCGEPFLEFLYWKGAAYQLEEYDAGVDDLHTFRAKHITPACSLATFYEKVRFRKNRILDQAMAFAGLMNSLKVAASESGGAFR